MTEFDYLLLSHIFNNDFYKLNYKCRDECEEGYKAYLCACECGDAEKRLHKRNKQYKCEQECSDKESAYACRV